MDDRKICRRAVSIPHSRGCRILDTAVGYSSITMATDITGPVRIYVLYRFNYQGTLSANNPPPVYDPTTELLQQRLNTYRATNPSSSMLPLTVDGLYGPQTAAALTVYQQENSLTADGIFGQNSYNSLFPSSMVTTTYYTTSSIFQSSDGIITVFIGNVIPGTIDILLVPLTQHGGRVTSINSGSCTARLDSPVDPLNITDNIYPTISQIQHYVYITTTPAITTVPADRNVPRLFYTGYYYPLG